MLSRGRNGYATGFTGENEKVKNDGSCGSLGSSARPVIGTENINLAESSDGTFHLAAFMNSNSLLVVNLKL